MHQGVEEGLFRRVRKYELRRNTKNTYESNNFLFPMVHTFFK